MYKKICTTYGEYLWKSSKFEEAEAMFRLGDDFKRALDAHQRCENFQLAKTVAMLMKTPLEQIKELAEEFLNLFRNADDHKGISEVLLDMYCNKMISNKEQIEELISSLVKAQDYFKAISIASECQRPDLISGEIYKGILLGYDILYNEIISNTNGYNEKYKRLLIVQEQKKLMPTLHIICEGCLKDVIKRALGSSSNNEVKIKCIQCREPTIINKKKTGNFNIQDYLNQFTEKYKSK